ncbi:MAG: hypothetical protein KDD75_00415, partial [Caldilineaceae bacterium]|nr:hypothetical protein [Caldilineaceae bacterium]
SGQDVALLRAYALAVEAGVFILTGGDVLFSVVRLGFNASPGGALIVGVSDGGASRLGVAPGGAALLGIAQGGMILLSAKSGGSGRIRAK